MNPYLVETTGMPHGVTMKEVAQHEPVGRWLSKKSKEQAHQTRVNKQGSWFGPRKQLYHDDASNVSEEIQFEDLKRGQSPHWHNLPTQPAARQSTNRQPETKYRESSTGRITLEDFIPEPPLKPRQRDQ